MATSTLSTSAGAENVERVRYSSLWWVGLMAIVLAVVANLAVRAFALPFITVPPEFLPLSIISPTIIFTSAGVLAATIAFAIVGRFSRRPARTYTIVAVVALLLSLIPNIAMLVNPASSPFPGSNPGSVSVLILQHIVAAVVAVWVLTTRGITTNAR